MVPPQPSDQEYRILRELIKNSNYPTGEGKSFNFEPYNRKKQTFGSIANAEGFFTRSDILRLYPSIKSNFNIYVDRMLVKKGFLFKELGQKTDSQGRLRKFNAYFLTQDRILLWKLYNEFAARGEELLILKSDYLKSQFPMVGFHKGDGKVPPPSLVNMLVFTTTDPIKTAFIRDKSGWIEITDFCFNFDIINRKGDLKKELEGSYKKWKAAIQKMQEEEKGYEDNKNK